MLRTNKIVFIFVYLVRLRLIFLVMPETCL